MTITEAAQNYIRAVDNWQHAKKAHADFLMHAVCVNQDALSKKWEDLETEPPRCYKRYYDDYPMPPSEWCETCKRSLDLYRHRVDMARRKGRAHATLRMAVKR